MNIVTKTIEIEDVEAAFRDIDEAFVISKIHFKYIHDPHYDDLALFVEIYGEEIAFSMFGEPSPVAEYTIDIEDVVTNEVGGIPEAMISTFFNPELFEYIIRNQAKVMWNQDDEETSTLIDIENAGDRILSPMIS